MNATSPRSDQPLPHAATRLPLSPRLSCLLILCALFLALLNPPALRAQTADTLPPVAYSTFIQLTNDMEAWTEQDWTELFSRFEALRIGEIVLQWSEYDTWNLFPATERTLRMASQRNMRVWVGLKHDSSWWTGITYAVEPLKAYLWKVFSGQARLGEAILDTCMAYPAFAGLYLPLELDDSTWNQPQKRHILFQTFRHFRATFMARHPGIPLAISGFSNGVDSPDAWAMFWKETALAAALNRVYVQDGVGAGKLRPQEAGLYLEATRRALESIGVETVAVVEAFIQTPSKPGVTYAANPTTLPLLAEQVRAAAAAGIRDVAFFAVPNYMTRFGGPDAATLGREWQKLLPPTTATPPRHGR